MTTYLAELYASRGSSAAAERIVEAIAASGTALRYLRSILVPGDEICFCLVEASSAAALTDLAETAGIELDRIVEVVVLDPETRKENHHA